MRIVITGFNRPYYMREVIASWAAARGIDRHHVEFHLEPGQPEMVQVCEDAPFPHSVHVSDQPLGVQKNPWKALSSGFESSEFVILGEDDIIVSTDVIEYFEWAVQEFREDQNIFAITSRAVDPCDPQTLGAATAISEFSGWVWGTWRHWWDKIGPDWRFAYEYNGWDYRLDEHWCRKLGNYTVRPNLSRCQHIGREGGTHCRPDMFDALASHCFVRDVSPRRYYRSKQPMSDPLEFRNRLWEGFTGAELAFDVGAGCGQHTESMLAVSERVVSFEPDRCSFQEIEDRWGRHDGVVARNIAVSSESGLVRLARHAGQLVTPGLSVDWMPYDWSQVPAQDYPCRTLDSLAGQFGTPDFVRVDTDGHEAEVLRGARRLIEDNGTDWLIEFHSPENLGACQQMLVGWSGGGYDVQVVRHPSYPESSPVWFQHGWLRALSR